MEFTIHRILVRYTHSNRERERKKRACESAMRARPLTHSHYSLVAKRIQKKAHANKCRSLRSVFINTWLFESERNELERKKKSIQHGRVYYVCLCGGASLMMSIGVCVALIKLARWMGGGTPQFIIIEVIEQIVRRRELTSYDFFFISAVAFFFINIQITRMLDNTAFV